MRFGRNPWPRSAKITTGVLGALFVIQGLALSGEPLPTEETAAEVVTETATEVVTETRPVLPDNFAEQRALILENQQKLFKREDRLAKLQTSLRKSDRNLDKRKRRLDRRAANLDERTAELEQQAVVAAPDPGPAVYYDTCSDAEAAGDTPLYTGDPGYASHLDGDGDGEACE